MKCKLHFSNKHSKGNSDILLREKNKPLLKNKKVADLFNSCFQPLTNSLDLFEWPLGSMDIYGSVARIIDSFCFHPSITSIKRNYKITFKISFKPVSKEFSKDTVNDLSSNKAAWWRNPTENLEIMRSFFSFSYKPY